jgi:hypothetical protein
MSLDNTVLSRSQAPMATCWVIPVIRNIWTGKSLCMVSSFWRLGEGRERSLIMALSFFQEWWKGFQSSAMTEQHSTNILKITDLYTCAGWLVWYMDSTSRDLRRNLKGDLCRAAFFLTSFSVASHSYCGISRELVFAFAICLCYRCRNLSSSSPSSLGVTFRNTLSFCFGRAKGLFPHIGPALFLSLPLRRPLANFRVVLIHAVVPWCNRDHGPAPTSSLLDLPSHPAGRYELVASPNPLWPLERWAGALWLSFVSSPVWRMWRLGTQPFRSI